ncbi:hypothetical protein ACTFIT_003303 [Dictyostelium discoideum]
MIEELIDTNIVTRGNKARKNSIVCSVNSDMVNQAIEQLRELIKIN